MQFEIWKYVNITNIYIFKYILKDVNVKINLVNIIWIY